MDPKEQLDGLYSLKNRIELEMAQQSCFISDDIVEALLCALPQERLSMITTSSLTDVLAVLSAEIHDLEQKSQQIYKRWAIRKWIAVPMRDGLDENKRKNMLIGGKFDNYFQLTYTASPDDYIKFKKDPVYHDAFIDACVVDDTCITDLVKERFALTDWPELVKEFKNKIKSFSPLYYIWDMSGDEKPTGRIWFFGDLPGIFVPQRTLFDAGENPTTWETRKTDAEMQLNIFDNLYDAIRSQIYTLDKEEEKNMQYKQYQDIFVTMLEDLIHDPALKQNEIKRQLISFAETIKNAENFRVMQAKLYHLPKISFSNTHHDRLQIGAIRTKIQKTIKDIDRISYYVGQQTEAMKSLLSQQESAITWFHSKALMRVDYTGKQDTQFTYSLRDYEQNVKNILATHKMKTLVAPFSHFDAQIRKVFGPYEVPHTTNWLRDKRGVALRPAMLKAEILCPLQRLVWVSYGIENELKVEDLVPEAIQWSFHLEEYLPLKQKYPEMYALFFQDMEDIILQFTKDLPLKEMEKLFHQLRDPDVLDAKIEALTYLK